MRQLGAGLGILACLATGCASRPRGAAAVVNPGEARAALNAMREDPKKPQRPIVILNGFRAPAIAARPLELEIVEATAGDSTDVALVAYPLIGDIDRCARAAVREVQARWPGGSADETAEVDVVGISMGGLVARWAALTPAQRCDLLAHRGEAPQSDFPRLRIARLFTFATPHQGSEVARFGLSPAARDMRPGSPFLNGLDAGPQTYATVSYAHLGDRMVQVDNAAPIGRTPIWSEGTLVLSHMSTHFDPVFVADLLRRLRDETPLLQTELPGPRE
jgi:pimeloyl-ACP methyl ester carboxylesterase